MRHGKLNTANRDDSGFTLIELLIAMALLLMALIPLAALFVSGLRASANLNVRMSARELAVSEISRIKDMDFKYIGMSGVTLTFSQASSGNQIGPDSGNGIQATSTATGPLNVNFTITRNVTKLVRTINGNPVATKQVTVTVTWPPSNPQGSAPITGGSEPEATEIGPSAMAASS